MTEFFVVIPARFASARLPGKPLLEINGKPMLQHVFEKAQASSATQVIIATDDARIEKAAQVFGADVCLTAAEHKSGTDRLAEVCVLREWPDNAIVVNLQGDEPSMPSSLIDQCAGLLADDNADLATLASALANRDDFRNPNVVKVVTDEKGYALLFSRAMIPYSRSEEMQNTALQAARHHHGIYAYRVATLKRLVAAEQSDIERCEQLEQLRAMSLGMRIKVGLPNERPGPGIDTEKDLRDAQSA